MILKHLASVAVRFLALILMVTLMGCSSDGAEVATSLPATTAPIDVPAADQPAAGSDASAPPDAAAPPVATPFAATAGAAVVELSDEAPAVWSVATDIDGVNVRANPGSSSLFLGVYPPGQQGIVTTGKRAELNGVEWKQIEFGGDGSTGWVAALYLRSVGAIEAGAAAPAPASAPIRADRRECYAGGPAGNGYTARFDFNDDGTSFIGGLRIDRGTGIEYVAVAASKVPPDPFTVAVRPVGGAERVETWAFGIDGVELPGATIDLASCGEIAALIGEIDQQVTSYPAAPAR